MNLQIFKPPMKLIIDGIVRDKILCETPKIRTRSRRVYSSRVFSDIDYRRYEPAHTSDYGDRYSLPPKIERLPDFVPLKEVKSRKSLAYAEERNR